MKSFSFKTIFNLYSKFLIIFIISIFICIGLITYLLQVSIGNENRWSSEPISITADFSKKIYFKDEKPLLTASGIEELNKYNLC